MRSAEDKHQKMHVGAEPTPRVESEMPVANLGAIPTQPQGPSHTVPYEVVGRTQRPRPGSATVQAMSHLPGPGLGCQPTDRPGPMGPVPGRAGL